MYKIIVTGGNGFIGAHLVDRLVEEGHSVHVIDDRSADLNNPIFNDKALYYRYDIGDKKQVELLSYVFDGAGYVFHLAAESRIQPAIKNPHKAHMTNGIGTLNILDMCHRFKIKKVIYSSTSSVYENDDTLDIETNEDHSISCLNPYSISKFFGEELCRYYSLNMGLETVVFRYFNVFGERSPDKGNYAPVVGIFLKQFRNGEPLTIFGSGLQKRDFIHVKDVVSANILAMNLSERTNGKPINIGSGYNVSLNSIAKLFNTQVYHYPRREGEVMNTLSSTKRAMDILGFYPTIRVEEWVADQVNKIKS